MWLAISCLAVVGGVACAAIKWDEMYNKTPKAPWVPALKDPFDVSHFDEFEEEDTIIPYEHDASTDEESGAWFTGFC